MEGGGRVGDFSEQLVWAALGSATVSSSIGWRASQLGHELTAKPGEKRFKIVCSCGWRSDSRWTRRRTILEASQHTLEVVYPPGAPDPAKVVHPVTVTRISDGASHLPERGQRL